MCATLHTFMEVLTLRVAVIGCGRVGTTLALTMMSRGHHVEGGLAVRLDSPSTRQFELATGMNVFGLTSPEGKRAVSSADLIFITTPDKAVTDTAQTLSTMGIVHEGQIVVHTSGALGSIALSPVKAHGALILSLHPLQTIASPTAGPSVLDGIYCTLEGDPLALRRGKDLVRSWGAIPVEIDPAVRPQYHAAAVLASNAVVALASVAAKLSGIEDGLQALLPLLKGAVRNLETLGLPDALTGPIERGDLTTVEAHMRALQNNPTALSVYAALGRATADLALAKGTLSTPMWQSFTALFCDNASMTPEGDVDDATQ